MICDRIVRQATQLRPEMRRCANTTAALLLPAPRYPRFLPMIPDRDLWASGLLMVECYGDDAILEAAQRSDELLENHDMTGAATRHRIIDCIERLQGTKPGESKAV